MLAAFEIFSCLIAVIYSGIWVPEFFTTTDNKMEPWSFIATSTLSGLMTVYVGFLALGDFQKVFYMCHAIGTISAIWLIIKARTGKITHISLPFEKVKYIFVGMSLLIVFAILFTGISDWQARSVWYFQAKILHHTGSLSSPDWHNPQYFFALTSHPKLYAVTIAFVTSSWHAWNEYVPKWTLLLFFLPIVASLFSMKLKTPTLFLLFLAFLGIPGSGLWNGSPDTYAALFFALAVLNFSHYQLYSEKNHLLQAILFMGIIPCFSPDGLAMVVCMSLAISFFHKDALLFVRDKNISKFIVIPFAAFTLWHLRKLEFHFDLDMFSLQVPASRMLERLVDIRPLMTVLKNLTMAHLDLFAFLLLVVVYFYLARAKEQVMNFSWNHPQIKWVLVSGGLYMIYIFLVYWATPFNIDWYASAFLKNMSLSSKLILITYVAMCFELDQAPTSLILEDE